MPWGAPRWHVPMFPHCLQALLSVRGPLGNEDTQTDKASLGSAFYIVFSQTLRAASPSDRTCHNRREPRVGEGPCQTHRAGVSEPGFLVVYSQLAFLPLENGANVSQDNMGRSCGLGR